MSHPIKVDLFLQKIRHFYCAPEEILGKRTPCIWTPWRHLDLRHRVSDCSFRGEQQDVAVEVLVTWTLTRHMCCPHTLGSWWAGHLGVSIAASQVSNTALPAKSRPWLEEEGILLSLGLSSVCVLPLGIVVATLNVFSSSSNFQTV